MCLMVKGHTLADNTKLACGFKLRAHTSSAAVTTTAGNVDSTVVVLVVGVLRGVVVETGETLWLGVGMVVVEFVVVVVVIPVVVPVVVVVAEAVVAVVAAAAVLVVVALVVCGGMTNTQRKQRNDRG